MYPDLSVQAFQNAANPDKGTQADYNSDCLHPVATGNSRMTERRILDMVAYLFCRENAPKEFRVQLHRAALPAKEVFNHYLDRYQKDYDRDELVGKFFLALTGTPSDNSAEAYWQFDGTGIPGSKIF